MKFTKYYYIRALSIPICLLLSLTGFMTSCKGQVNKEPVKESASQPGLVSAWVPANNPLDKDPYFIENKDSISPYGHRGITRNIIQDKNDNIWFASYTGVVRFKDGMFTNFTNMAGLRRYRIFSVFEDKAGNIWFGTVGAGVFRYNGTTFKNFTVSDGLVDNKVECITEDKAGNIWFGTGNGVSSFDGKNFRNFTTQDSLVDPDIHAIIQDRSGLIWVGALGGVFFYDPANLVKGQPAFTALNKSPAQPFKNVRSIIEDNKGQLWFGGQNGLFTYDGLTIKNITADFTGNLYEDRKGNIWFSAGIGEKAGKMSLYQYTMETIPMGAANLNITHIKKEDGQIFGIIEDRNGNIRFGTLGGACRYDGKTFNYFRK